MAIRALRQAIKGDKKISLKKLQSLAKKLRVDIDPYLVTVTYMNEQSLKEKLRFIANERNMTFQEVWKKLTLERFLARLSASDLRDQFVFKGGLLLSYYIELGRETKDIDFLATNMETNEESIREKIEEVSETHVDDGFQFKFEKIELLGPSSYELPGIQVEGQNRVWKYEGLTSTRYWSR